MTEPICGIRAAPNEIIEGVAVWLAENGVNRTNESYTHAGNVIIYSSHGCMLVFKGNQVEYCFLSGAVAWIFDLNEPTSLDKLVNCILHGVYE